VADSTIPKRDYYVYALFRRDTGVPFYLGYGRGNRWLQHERDTKRRQVNGQLRRGNHHKESIIRQILLLSKDIPKIKIAADLTLNEAKRLEIIFIAAIGRHPNGPLTNLTAGGEGISRPTEELRQKISTSMASSPKASAARHQLAIYNTGRKWTGEQRANHLAARRASAKVAAHMREMTKRKTGSKLSDEVKKRMSLARKRWWLRRRATGDLFD
jgi:hypothetical protein